MLSAPSMSLRNGHMQGVRLRRPPVEFPLLKRSGTSSCPSVSPASLCPPTVPSPQACLVPTSETVRVCYFLEQLLERRRPVMLVGTASTSKSVLVGATLAGLDAEEYLVKNVPFNYYTTSAMLQGEGRGACRGAGEGAAGWLQAPPPTWSQSTASGTCRA